MSEIEVNILLLGTVENAVGDDGSLACDDRKRGVQKEKISSKVCLSTSSKPIRVLLKHDIRPPVSAVDLPIKTIADVDELLKDF